MATVSEAPAAVETSSSESARRRQVPMWFGSNQIPSTVSGIGKRVQFAPLSKLWNNPADVASSRWPELNGSTAMAVTLSGGEVTEVRPLVMDFQLLPPSWLANTGPNSDPAYTFRPSEGSTAIEIAPDPGPEEVQTPWSACAGRG